ncbi:MAG: MerR family transcriptional regulator [Betaproteobacteria bacterium]
MLTIGQVERDTGLSKDTLRMWERRYGFPEPGRDAAGERLYDSGQVHKLRLIKRLIDAGNRPGKLVGQSVDELDRLGADQPRVLANGASRESLGEFIELLQRREIDAFQQYLSQSLMRKGLEQFLLTTLVPLNISVGEAWARGELATFDEHLYTEYVQTLLRTVIHGMPRRSELPRVLITTLPQELHALGLLMVESLLASEGIQCVSLGTQTPLQDLLTAAEAHRADIVALSFSSSFPTRAAATAIASVRRELAPTTSLWVGGGLTGRLKHLPDGVTCLPQLEQLIPAVNEWKVARRSAIV